MNMPGARVSFLMVGGKRKTEIRNATPVEFRDVMLISISNSARSAIAA